MKLTYPEHAYPSARSFKAKKRADAKAALKALQELRLGCAYMPTQGKIIDAIELIEESIDLMSAKNWGR